MQQFLEKHRKIVRILSVLVVFITTYALILPAITLEKDKAQMMPGLEVGSSSSDQSDTVPAESEETKSDGAEVASEQPSEGPPLIKETVALEATGLDYQVMVDISEAAQLPQGTALEVSEIQPDSVLYQERYDQTLSSLPEGQVMSARFFHISLVYEGKEIEPASGVTVRFHYQNPLTVEQGNALLAAHFLDQATSPEYLPITARKENESISAMSFRTESFSDFGIIETNESAASGTALSGQAHYKVVFEVDGQEVTSISNLPADSLVGALPDTPFKPEHRFIRWQDKATGQEVTADTQVTADMTVEAVFEHLAIYQVEIQYYYTRGSDGTEQEIDKEIHQLEEEDTPFRVTPPASFDVSPADDPALTSNTTYYPQEAVIEIDRNQLATLDQADGVEDKRVLIRVPFIPANASFNYIYWIRNIAGTAYVRMETVPARGILGTTISPRVLSYEYAEFERANSLKLTQSSGQNLHIFYTRKNYTLSYESNGGSYIAPQSGVYQQNISISSEVPNRRGYAFDGWYTSPTFEVGSKVGATLPLNQNITLYAKWVPQMVPYTIVYYKEQYDNATNATSFEYDSSVAATGLAGSVVTAASAPAIPTDTLGYELDADQNATSQVEIAPDGTSILKVYYKLKRYTFVFNLNKPTATISMNGGQYRNATYTIPDVVLGRDISRFWPSETTEIRSGDTTTFTGWLGAYRYISRQFNTTTELIANADSSNRVTYTAQWSTGNFIARRVDYYLQSADNPNEYPASQYGQTFNLLYNHNFSAKELDGFEVMASPPAGYPNHGQNVYRVGFTNRMIVDHYRFYYRRKSYALRYYYGSQELNSHTVLFDANINKSPYTDPPARPAGVDADYTWGGWYADANFNSLYAFDKMPQANVALYARWIPPEYTVSFDVNGGDSPAPPSQTVEKREQVVQPPAPTRQYFDFVGWYTEPEGGVLYDWSKPVTSNQTLYARWRPKPIAYRVRYLEAGTNQPIMPDKVVSSSALAKGQVVTETALAYTGYRPNERTQSLELDYENNTIIFYYTKKVPATTYTVRYVLKDNPAIEVAPSKTITVDGSWISVKEEALLVDKAHLAQQPGVTSEMLATDYYPEKEVQSMVVSADTTDNVITFEYIEYETAHLILNYLDMDGNPIPGQDPVHVYRRKPGSYSVERKDISGYVLDHTVDSNKERDKTYYQVTKSEQITINLYYKKELILEPVSREKIYDGQALTLSNQVSELNDTYRSQLVAGDRLDKIAFEGSQTDAGQSASRIQGTSVVIIDAAGKNRNDYYAIELRPSVLKVNPAPVDVIVTGQTTEKVYDAQSAQVSYTTQIIDPSARYKETDIRFDGADKTVTGRDAGHYSLVLTNQFTNTNPNFVVNFTTSDGSLSILPRKVRLVSSDIQGDYRGQALIDSTGTVTAGQDGFVGLDGVSVVMTGRQTAPGYSPNSFTYEFNPGTTPSNYQIETVFGTLRVLPKVNLQKTTPDWTPLAGGKFRLTKWDGSMWAAVEGGHELVNTSPDGLTLSKGLAVGRYRLEELAAPDGYIVLDNSLYFAVKEDGDGIRGSYTIALTAEDGSDSASSQARLLDGQEEYTNRIQISNQPGQALPQTGGSGHIWVLLGGGLCVLYAAYGFHRRKRYGV